MNLDIVGSISSTADEGGRRSECRTLRHWASEPDANLSCGEMSGSEEGTRQDAHLYGEVLVAIYLLLFAKYLWYADYAAKERGRTGGRTG